MNDLLIIFLLSIILLCIYTKEKFESYYLAQPTKCFSCEKELPQHLKYLGGPTKCFSCEKQMINQNLSGDLGQNTKCFSCEKQMGNKILTFKNNSLLI